jgi:hypothetical protein
MNVSLYSVVLVAVWGTAAGADGTVTFQAYGDPDKKWSSTASDNNVICVNTKDNVQATSATVSGTTLLQFRCPISGMLRFRAVVSSNTVSSVNVRANALQFVSYFVPSSSGVTATGGTGTNIQYRIDGTTLGGVSGSSVSGSMVTLGILNLTNALGVAYGGTGTATAFTQGSVVFAGAAGIYSQDNTNFFWDDTNNRLGIGITVPRGGIDVANSATSALQYISTYSATSTHKPALNFLKSASNTIGTLTTTVNNEFLANISFQGVSATNTISDDPAYIAVYQDGNAGATRVPGRIEFGTGSGSGATTKMTITGVGNVGIGTSTFGTSMLGGIALFAGTCPTTAPADTGQVCVTDIAGAGTAGWKFYDEGLNTYSLGSGRFLMSNLGSRTSSAISSISYANAGLFFLDVAANGGVALASGGNEYLRVLYPAGVLINDGVTFTTGGTGAAGDTGIFRNTAGVVEINNGTVGTFRDIKVRNGLIDNKIKHTGFLFVNIATVLAADGEVGYCSDCTIANPCAGSGTGALAKRLNGVNVCN